MESQFGKIHYEIPHFSVLNQNSFNKGPLVSLHMEDASGIEAGKTVVKFRSVDVGVVESVSL